MRELILKGDSLFTLAGEFSIDPAGKKKNGDMGWFVKGRGMPELDNALDKLEVDKLSDVIETKAGFHLLTVLEHQPEKHKTYDEVHDRVRQLVINEKLPAYLGELERLYNVTWNVIKGREGNKQITRENP